MSATDRTSSPEPHKTAPDRATFDEIARLATEQRNPRTMDLDRLSTVEVLTRINDEDRTIADVVRGEIPHIAQAVEFAHASLAAGGRILYMGAGTSGRLGVLDASECPPTFGTPPEWVQGIIAGGYGALLQAVEGAEDKADDGAEQIRRARVEPMIASGPTTGQMATSTSCVTSERGVQVTSAVRAPRARASASAPTTKGVRREAAIPTTKSRGSTRARRTCSAPSSALSSAPSTACSSAP